MPRPRPKQPPPLSHYSTLGVSRTATPAEIRRAYRKLVRIYHPDVTGNDSEKTKKFYLVQRAYETLSDRGKRMAYDRLLEQRAQSFETELETPESSEPEVEEDPFESPSIFLKYLALRTRHNFASSRYALMGLLVPGLLFGLEYGDWRATLSFLKLIVFTRLAFALGLGFSQVRGESSVGPSLPAFLLGLVAFWSSLVIPPTGNSQLVLHMFFHSSGGYFGVLAAGIYGQSLNTYQKQGWQKAVVFLFGGIIAASITGVLSFFTYRGADRQILAMMERVPAELLTVRGILASVFLPAVGAAVPGGLEALRVSNIITKAHEEAKRRYFS